jgi:predicted aspartyl protease
MHVNGKPIKFQVDSGASYNVIPVSILQDVDYKSNTVLTTYNC